MVLSIAALLRSRPSNTWKPCFFEAAATSVASYRYDASVSTIVNAFHPLLLCAMGAAVDFAL